MVCGDFNTTLVQEERVRNGMNVPSSTAELQSLLADTRLVDLRSTGNYLTWCNNQHGEDRMYCKLDRVLVNSLWVSNYDNSQVLFLAAGISDHSPSLVKLLLM